MFRHILILVFVLAFFLQAGAQNKIDSLQKIIRDGGHDSELMLAYTELAKQLYTNNPKAARATLDTAFSIASKLQHQKGLADIYHVYAITYYFESDMQTALDYNFKALAIRKKLKDKEGLTRSYNNMGLIYEITGDMKTSLKYHNLSLKIEEELKRPIGIAQTLGNIGNLYFNVGSFEQALSYQFKTLEILKRLKNNYEIATNYGNIANIYDRLGQHKRAIDFNEKSIQLHKKTNNTYGHALSLSNLALIYVNIGKLDKARAYANESKRLYAQIGNKEGVARATQIMGDILLGADSLQRAPEVYLESGRLYAEVGDPEGEAEAYIGIALCNKRLNNIDGIIKNGLHSLSLVKDKGYLITQARVYELLYQAYQKKGDYKNAFEYQAQSHKLNDSISKNKGVLAIQKQELTREYEQRNLSDSLHRVKKQALEKAKADAKTKQQTIVRISLIAGIVIVAVFLLIVFNRLRVIRKQKKEIEKGHLLLEEKNKEIVDSINYAWHIQHGMIPAPDKVKTVFPDSFVLYLPKDKLSGDFYWAANVIDKNLGELNAFAVADCTGHGVPGALVSITGINYLKLGQQIPEVNSPAEALNFVNKGFYSLFEENTGIRDGMDIVVGSYHKKSMTLQYSCAKNPIILIRDNEIIELKGDKHPIGRFGPETPQPFTNHSYQLAKGDVAYIFSDGYVDQFGGVSSLGLEEKSSKFKSGNFKKLLLEIHKKPLAEQEKILHETILKWRGNIEQTDDITVFGVRF